jgi:hypothetical protein
MLRRDLDGLVQVVHLRCRSAGMRRPVAAIELQAEGSLGWRVPWSLTCIARDMTIIKAAAVQMGAEYLIRQHALESTCFVVNATAWLDADQQRQIMHDTGYPMEPISSGCFTAIVSPRGELMGEPLRSGEGVVIANASLPEDTGRWA